MNITDSSNQKYSKKSTQKMLSCNNIKEYDKVIAKDENTLAFA